MKLLIIFATFILFSFDRDLYSKSDFDFYSDSNSDSDSYSDSAKLKRKAIIPFTTKCLYSCHDELKLILPKSVYSIFNVNDYDMRSGNGLLFTQTTTSIKYHNLEICIQTALEGCKTMGQIKSVKVEEIQSGELSISDTSFSCFNHKSTEPIRSPFDVKIQNNVKLLPNTISSSFLRGYPRFEWYKKFSNQSESPKNNFVSAQNCSSKTYVEGVSCYGDCMGIENDSENKMCTNGFDEYLATSLPLGNHNLKFCADDVLALAKKNKIKSQDLLNYYCETYLLQMAKKYNRLALSCASYRIQLTKCPTL